jgi:hypothetical protein
VLKLDKVDVIVMVYGLFTIVSGGYVTALRTSFRLDWFLNSILIGATFFCAYILGYVSRTFKQSKQDSSTESNGEVDN